MADDQLLSNVCSGQLGTKGCKTDEEKEDADDHDFLKEFMYTNPDVCFEQLSMLKGSLDCRSLADLPCAAGKERHWNR